MAQDDNTRIGSDKGMHDMRYVAVAFFTFAAGCVFAGDSSFMLRHDGDRDASIEAEDLVGLVVRTAQDATLSRPEADSQAAATMSLAAGVGATHSDVNAVFHLVAANNGAQDVTMLAVE